MDNEVVKTGVTIIKLKTKFYSEEYNEADAKNAELIGQEYKRPTEPGYVYINMNRLDSFYKSYDDKTTLVVSSEPWVIDMKFDEFLELIGLEEDNLKED